ncbi:MAG: substrate-binding domain-containing protein [Pseudomonadota bacterium]
MPTTRRTVLTRLLLLGVALTISGSVLAEDKRLAYIVSDLRIPFWDILRRGVTHQAEQLGYRLEVYSAENSAKREVEFVTRAIRDRVDGIILSPTHSSAAVTLLKLAGKAGIPVVIADIGTDGGPHVSTIVSDNRKGAYQLGRILGQALKARGWQKGSVGIIAIPQKRANGKARTAGFMQALQEAGIRGADLRQQVSFSYQETYDFTRALIAKHPDLRALWLQGSDRYQAALDAIAHAARTDQILLICFDAEPEFIDMIEQGRLVGAGMQQPFLMGETAVQSLDTHLKGGRVARHQSLPVLAVSRDNLKALLPTIRRNVLGLEVK